MSVERVVKRLLESHYDDWIAAGNDPKDWDAYRDKKNAESRAAGRASFEKDWESGKPLNGPSIANHFYHRGIDVPDDLKRILNNDDTEVSRTSAKGRGLSRAQAGKLHKYVSLTFIKLLGKG